MTRTISSSYTTTLAGLTMGVVELYKISAAGMSTFTYTDANIKVSYAGLTYDPYSIKRGKISFSTDLKVDQTEITLAKNWGIDNAVVKDVLAGADVQITRVNLDLPDTDNLLLFDGEVSDTQKDELDIILRCQTLDFLNTELPKREIQVACNWRLYDPYCGLTQASYTVGVTSGGTLDYNPDPDTYISQSSAGTTFSSSTNLTVSGVTNDLYRTLMMFDFSAINTTATITSSVLQMYYHSFTAGGATNRVINAARITNTTWDNDTSWNNQPAYTVTGMSTATVPGATNTWMEWDVTDQVITAKDSVGKNAHFILFDETEGTALGGVNFYSSDHSDASLRPILSVRHEKGIDVLHASTSRGVLVSNSFTLDANNNTSGYQYLRGGFVKAISGKNDLLKRHVVAHTSSLLGTTHDTVYVLPPFPFDFEVTDGIEFAPGCDHNLDDCENKFSNLINYGGFPYIPNQDSMF